MVVKPKSKGTAKDIRYALEYGGEKLLKTIREGKPVQWTFARSGLPVDTKEAERFIQSDPHVYAMEDGLFPGHSQTFGWRP